MPDNQTVHFLLETESVQEPLGHVRAGRLPARKSVSVTVYIVGVHSLNRQFPFMIPGFGTGGHIASICQIILMTVFCRSDRQAPSCN